MSEQNDNNDLLNDAATEEEIELKFPKEYRVLIHNDDYTPMEFVVSVLVDVFRKNNADATNIMLKVHKLGVGICGVFSYEIAETKVSRVHELAEKHEFPLKATMEEV